MLLLAKEVVRILDDEIVATARLDLAHDLAHVPSGAVGGVVEEQESPRFEELVAVLEVAPDELVRVVAVDVAEADLAAESDLTLEDIAHAPSLAPRLEELVREHLDGVGQVVAAEEPEVAPERLLHEGLILVVRDRRFTDAVAQGGPFEEPLVDRDQPIGSFVTSLEVVDGVGGQTAERSDLQDRRGARKVSERVVERVDVAGVEHPGVGEREPQDEGVVDEDRSGRLGRGLRRRVPTQPGQAVAEPAQRRLDQTLHSFAASGARAADRSARLALPSSIRSPRLERAQLHR